MTIEQDFETARECILGHLDGYQAKEALSRIEAEVKRLRAEEKAHPYGPRWADLEAENERLRTELKYYKAELDKVLAKNQRLRNRVDVLQAQLDDSATQVERLRAALSKGCERDPLHQCPNCRQALEEVGPS
jgi:predicted RNase H-like nuclease (RuvC/YqgF family)